jgi:hypothetical protein
MSKTYHKLECELRTETVPLIAVGSCYLSSWCDSGTSVECMTVIPRETEQTEENNADL